MRTYVVELPRRVRPLFEGERGSRLRFIEARASPTMTRLEAVDAAPLTETDPSMAHDFIRPRPDMVDSGLFIETRGTATMTAALWRLLNVTRQDPRPWIPMTVLADEPGSDRTTIAQRFVTATQKHTSCDLIRERAAGPDPAQDQRDAEAVTGASRWAERMTLEFGSCPAWCHTAA